MAKKPEVSKSSEAAIAAAAHVMAHPASSKAEKMAAAAVLNGTHVEAAAPAKPKKPATKPAPAAKAKAKAKAKK